MKFPTWTYPGTRPAIERIARRFSLYRGEFLTAEQAARRVARSVWDRGGSRDVTLVDVRGTKRDVMDALTLISRARYEMQADMDRSEAVLMLAAEQAGVSWDVIASALGYKSGGGMHARRRATKLVNEWRVFFDGATIGVDAQNDDETGS